MTTGYTARPMPGNGEASPRIRRAPVALAGLLAAACVACIVTAVACNPKHSGSDGDKSNSAATSDAGAKTGNTGDGAVKAPPKEEPEKNPLAPALAKFYGTRAKMVELIAARGKLSVDARSRLPSTTVGTPQTLQAPDSVTVIIRDMLGYSDDCGCSGEIIGGIPRVAGVLPECPMPAPGMGNSTRRFVFVGTLLAKLAVPRQQWLTDPVLAQLPGRIFVFSRIFEALGNVTWVPDPAEMNELNKEKINGKPIDFSLLDKWRLKPGEKLVIEGMEATLRLGDNEKDAGDITLASKSFDGTADVQVKATLPQVDDRARTALVFMRWHGLDETGAYVAPAFGEQYYLTREGKRPDMDQSAFHTVNEIHSKRKGAVAAWWREPMTKSSVPDPIIAAVVDRAEFEGGHAVITAGGLQKFDQRGVLLNATKDCAGCHSKAYAAWNASRHSHAFQTLFNLTKHTDSRCTGCHIQKVQVIEGSNKLDSLPQHRAVTCMTCHEGRGVAAKDSCVLCHNKLTDPESKYLPHTGDICPGAKDNVKALGGVKCSRADMLK
jgi:hypothetical protein